MPEIITCHFKGKKRKVTSFEEGIDILSSMTGKDIDAMIDNGKYKMNELTDCIAYSFIVGNTLAIICFQSQDYSQS